MFLWLLFLYLAMCACNIIIDHIQHIMNSLFIDHNIDYVVYIRAGGNGKLKRKAETTES